MPRPRNSIPKFYVGQDGRAYTKVNGRLISLGRDADPASRLKYAKIIQQHAAGLPLSCDRIDSDAGLSINQVGLAYLTWAADHYRQPHSGKPNAEYDCQKSMVKMLRKSFGLLPAAQFGPNKLRVVQAEMVAAGWSRTFINRSIGRVRQMFKWAVGRELVHADVWQSLRAVEPLSAGKTDAVEHAPRLAVPDSDIQAVRAVLNPLHRDVFDLILFTGARPSEIIRLTIGEIDRSGDLWKASLLQHKTAHRGKTRVLFFNPAAQEILQRHLKDDPSARLFQLRRDNFNHHIGTACAKAGVPKFVTHQLRHTAATRIRDQLGIETAAAVLGHSKIDMTCEYSRAADQHAIRGVQVLG